MPQSVIQYSGLLSKSHGPIVGGANDQGMPYAAAQLGNTYFVDVNHGATTGAHLGRPNTPFSSLQAAINVAVYGDSILVAPGSYNEAITIARPSYASLGLTIRGIGPKGSVGIAPTASNASGLTNHADDVSLINVGVAAVGTGKALINTGARLRALGCKLENDDATGLCAQMTLGTNAQHTAGTRGNGADCLLADCEFAWAASGVELVCTDYGAVTELQIVRGWFHDLDTKHIYETVGSGGSATVTYATLLLDSNRHQQNEAGSAPSSYVLLNANNANSGLMVGCYYPQAANGGKVLTSTKLIQVGNISTAGIQAAAFS